MDVLFYPSGRLPRRGFYLRPNIPTLKVIGIASIGGITGIGVPLFLVAIVGALLTLSFLLLLERKFYQVNAMSSLWRFLALITFTTLSGIALGIFFVATTPFLSTALTFKFGVATAVTPFLVAGIILGSIALLGSLYLCGKINRRVGASKKANLTSPAGKKSKLEGDKPGPSPEPAPEANHPLKTKTAASSDFKFLQPPYLIPKEILKTPYLKSLNVYSKAPYLLQNYGLIKANHPVEGLFLTIDMCPSSKAFEKDFFESLVALSNKTHRPIPIALSVTGRWLTKHPQEFQWLVSQEKQKTLDITWINHSFSHVYYPDSPLENNFMLISPEDFEKEALENEKLLLAQQEIPSVFFRFPGLVSNKELVKKLRDLGLIPVGSNAWLAKGEQPTNGSIVLVHGNSNEHKGIIKIMTLLQDKKIHWLPLAEAL